jgi:hypothetical protein
MFFEPFLALNIKEKKMRFKNYTILFFLLASFWFGSHAKATDQIDQTFSFNNYLYLTDGWSRVGQRIVPNHNNISKIIVDNQNYNPPSNAIVVICSGTPNNTSKADFEANLMTCNWAGNSLIRSETITPAGAGGDEYSFASPVPVSAGQNYYIGFYPQSPTTIVSMYNSAGNGLILNENGGTWSGQMGVITYYSDTYTPPPPTPTFQIQLLTPATTTPYTTYYGQPASYTFNYMNPLNWYPQIRFMVKRLADANAAAWPDYENSANFWTSRAATSTLTYGTASFRLPDGQYSLRVDYWANIPAMLGVASTTFNINTGGTYGGYSFSTSTTLFIMPTFNESDVCNGIATSTIFGAIECGLNKALYGVVAWAFVPSFDTLQNFRVSYELWKGCFPFNTYFQLTDTITNAASSTASTTSGTIKIPFIHTNGSYYMLDAVSSSTLSNWIGATNYNSFRTGIGYFFWLIAIGIIFFTVKYI